MTAAGLLLVWRKRRAMEVDRRTIADRERQWLEERGTLQIQAEKYRVELAAAHKEIDRLEVALRDNKASVQENREFLKNQFASLSSAMLRDQSDVIQKQHGEQLANMLAPLREQLREFKSRVESKHEQDLRDRSSIAEQIRSLTQLNTQLSSDAKGLTQALTGRTKTQGMWGEYMLERILEAGGLREGHEFIREGKGLALWDDDQRLQKPDVVVMLPDGKHLVVDAKVSLSAYERCVNAADPALAQQALKEHVRSLQRHASGLAKRFYQAHPKLMTPDLVLLFVPVEGALSSACDSVPSLLSDAWEQRVIIASPTTLLASVLTVASLWKYANQNKNALEIAKQGGKLYDKIALFSAQMEKAGKHLDGAHQQFHEAWDRLCNGRDNVLRNAEKLKDLGVRSKKDLTPVLESFSNANRIANINDDPSRHQVDHV